MDNNALPPPSQQRSQVREEEREERVSPQIIVKNPQTWEDTGIQTGAAAAADDDDDDEVVEQDEGWWKIFVKIYRAICGSITVLLMNISIIVVVLMTSAMNSRDEAAADSWKIGSLLITGALILSASILLIRFIWIKLILKPFFPEQRSLKLLTWFLDPEFGTLLWTITCLILYTGLFQASTSGGGTPPPEVGGVPPPEVDLFRLQSIGYISEHQYRTYFLTIVFLVLWASRDCIVKAIMLKLMLGFLMNFNNEVVQFLHRYSQIRRLNAALVKLVPTSDLSRSVSSVDPNGLRPLVTNYPLVEGENLVTVASLDDDTKSPQERAKRQREFSKQRLRAIATVTRSLSKQHMALGRQGSKVAADPPPVDEQSMHTAFEVAAGRGSRASAQGIIMRGEGSKIIGEGSEEPLFGQTGSKWTFDFANKRRRQRKEREYHVDYTGRILPSILEVKSILDTQKSQLSNLLAINTLREQPVLIFIDGQRCELSTKARAKWYGALLFKTLLEFRQTLIDVEEEEKALMFSPDYDQARAAARALGIVSKRLSSISFISARGTHQDLPEFSDDEILDQSPPNGNGDNLTLQIPRDLASDRGSVAPPASNARSYSLAQSRSSLSSFSDGRDVLLVERSVGDNHIDSEARYLESFGDADVMKSESAARRRLIEEDAQHRSAYPASFSHEGQPPHHLRHRGRTSGLQEEHGARWNLDSTIRMKGGANGAGGGNGGGGGVSARHVDYTDAQLAAITADEIRKVRLQMPDDRDCLTSDFFELFMSPGDAKQLCLFLDPGRMGKITEKMFTKGIVQTYRLRKQIIHSLEAQEEIESVFTRVCQYLVTFICILLYLLILGVDPNAIIVTGVSVLTAAGLVLSFVYTDFVQSIIFLVFLNPYRIGDRVRIDDEPQYVRRITTYFTEFETLWGKPQYMSHKELAAKIIINESRCKNATSEFQIYFSEKTSPSQYVAFKKVLEAYLRSRPQDFVGGSLFVYIMGVAPSHFVQLSIWVTHTEGWGNWMFIRANESSFLQFVMRQAQILGMYYRLPVQRWQQLSGPDESSPVPPPVITDSYANDMGSTMTQKAQLDY